MNSLSNSKITYLNWTQRPEKIQSEISKAHEKLTQAPSSMWGCYNGQADYSLCGVKEYALMKKIILDNPKRKDFYALDIGCGNFQWSRGLAAFIREQTDLPKDITVHIFGIRGESYFGDRVVETDRCKIYSLGAFKVEELFAQFKEQGFDLENKVDLAVTRWCFRHLVDPVGTFVQAYNLLLPHTGLFLLDGFFFNQEEKHDPNDQMMQFFLDTKAPFLMKYYDLAGSLNHFMLRRPDENPCQLQMSYLGLVSRPGETFGLLGSHHFTKFKREPQKEDKELTDIYEEEFGCSGIGGIAKNAIGDKKMCDWLRKNELFDQKYTSWAPLLKKDVHLGQPSLHKAVLDGNRPEVEKCLKNGADINESDAMGCTALHLSILKLNYDLFRFLFGQGAHLGLHDSRGLNPLSLAAVVDTDGQFLQDLIQAGSDVNIQDDWCRLPLDFALWAKNLKAIEILRKAGAEQSDVISEGLFRKVKSLKPNDAEMHVKD